MSIFEEWMTSFLGGQDTFTTPKQKETATRAFKNFKSLEDKDRIGLEQLKEVCRRIDQYVSQARPRHGLNKDQTLILDPFFADLLDFIICLSSFNMEVHEFLRDDTTMLASLTSFLNDKYQKQDQAKILQTIEVLTKGITVSWTMPYLSSMIKQTFAILLSTNTTADLCLYGLRIVSNLLFNNHNCLSIVLREANYRDVLKRLISMLSKKESSHELTTMALNFCYTTDRGISVNILTQIENIKNTFTEILAKIETENFSDVQGIATTLYYITMCVSTILNQCVDGLEESVAEEIEDNRKETTSIVRKIVEEISNVVLSKFFTKLFPLLRTERGQVIVFSLMNLMQALCPSNVPAEEYDNLWESFAKSLNELSMVASDKSKAQVVVLETHLHFVDRILKSNVKNQVPANAFKYALNHCQIVISSDPVDLTRNILTIRLLNRLNALASSQGRSDTNTSVINTVSKHLSEEPLSKLLYELLSEKTDEDKSLAPCIQLSTCVVEVLNAIVKLPKGATSILGSLEKEKTWFHISNCIVNGNEELISQALKLTGAAGFSGKCITGVSKTLMEMRESFSTFNKSTPVSPEKPACPSFAAQLGVKKLNDHLEMFEQNHVEGNDQAIDDVLAWYKLKNDMHEMELSDMNDHIFHLNRTINHLKALLNKQAELVTKRTVSNVTMQKDFTDLQKQLEVTKQKKVDLEMKHLKAMQSLRQQLSYQEGLYKSKCDRVAVLEKQLREMKEKCADLEKSRDEAVQLNREVTAEKRKLQDRLDVVEKDFKTSKQRLSTVESDLKKSEEARKAAETLLEAERRKTEIIQQVLGNRLN